MPEFLVILFQAIAWLLMLTGCVFVFAGGIGLIRLPDLYTRIHAAGVIDTGSTIFMVMAMMLMAVVEYQNPWIMAKLLLILFFTLFTTPTASHALAKTALLSGHVPIDENGKPILSSPELAQKVAMSRAPSDGPATVAAGVDAEHCDVAEESPRHSDTKGDNDGLG